MTRAKRVGCSAVVVVALVAWSDAGAKSPTGPREPAPSAGREGAPDAKALIERSRKCLATLSPHIAKLSYGRADLERYVAQWPSFDALDLHEAREGAKEEGPECVDLPSALADPRYAAWARERKLDAKDWLLKSLRISLTYVKWRSPAQAAEMKAQMETQRRELEKSCKSMGPDACRDFQQAFARSDDAMREVAAMMAMFPDPTPSEAALLREYDGRLREAQEGSHRRERRHGGLYGEPDGHEAEAADGGDEAEAGDAGDAAGR